MLLLQPPISHALSKGKVGLLQLLNQVVLISRHQVENILLAAGRFIEVASDGFQPGKGALLMQILAATLAVWTAAEEGGLLALGVDTHPRDGA